MTFSLTGFTISLIAQVLRTVGLPGLFALMAVESFGIPPLPSEVILSISGLLIAEGTDPSFTWPSVILVALAGGLFGSFVAYEVGRRLGLPVIVRWGATLGLDAKDLERAEHFFARRGPATVFLCRLVPLIRAFISYPAGAARMERLRFGAYTLGGSAPFTVALVYAGYVLGANYDVLEPYFNYVDVVVVGLAVVLVLWLYVRARHRREAAQAKGTPPSPPPAA